MARFTRTADRSHLKIADLKARNPTTSRLMNVKIPGHIFDAIDRIAQKLDTTKTAVVIALLEVGLGRGGKIKRN